MPFAGGVDLGSLGMLPMVRQSARFRKCLIRATCPTMAWVELLRAEFLLVFCNGLNHGESC
jgi:hypothetical protein